MYAIEKFETQTYYGAKWNKVSYWTQADLFGTIMLAKYFDTVQEALIERDTIFQKFNKMSIYISPGALNIVEVVDDV